jgi:hypothetical protein
MVVPILTTIHHFDGKMPPPTLHYTVAWGNGVSIHPFLMEFQKTSDLGVHMYKVQVNSLSGYQTCRATTTDNALS